MEQEELIFKLALSRVDGVGPVKFKKLVETFGKASEVFRASPKQLKAISGLSLKSRHAIRNFQDFDRIQREIHFADRNQINIITIDDPLYPTRLKLCPDSPSVLFLKGTVDLNHPRILGVIGTRNHSDYGRKACEELVAGLQSYNVLIVSGLAMGIDAIAHKTSVQHNMLTLGVLAHGLDIMYPAAHRSLSKDMIKSGGLLTEYFTDTKPDKGNFPSRNRIVAGLCDAVLIIETDRKGGSMITAEIAYSYNRDIFCVPGRLYDTKSSGCNELVRALKGQIVTSVEDIVKGMGWSGIKEKKVKQATLFIDLNEEEQLILDLLRGKGDLHIDEVLIATSLSNTSLAGSILGLEMKGLLRVLPGKVLRAN